MAQVDGVTSNGRPALDFLLLTLASGAMDALSFLHSGVFAANMTGNTVLLGLSIAGAERSRTAYAAVSIASFAIGAFTGAVANIRLKANRNWREDLKIGAALELPLLIAFACLYFVSPHPSRGNLSLALTGTAACALGLQSAAVRRLKISGVSTTYITGTITTAMVKLAAKDAGALESEEEGSPAVLLGMFAVYIFAAAAAAGLVRAGVTAVAAIPLAIVATVEARCFAAE